jgi:LysM repeat protein
MVQPLNNPYYGVKKQTPSAKGNRVVVRRGANEARRSVRLSVLSVLKARLAAAGVAAVFMVGGVTALNAGKAYFAGVAAPATIAVTVPMRVTPGDSLWSLARRYGNQNQFIVDRVEEMARLNGISSGENILPGQRILVKVENPAEVARLKQNVAVVQLPITDTH